MPWTWIATIVWIASKTKTLVQLPATINKRAIAVLTRSRPLLGDLPQVSDYAVFSFVVEFSSTM